MYIFTLHEYSIIKTALNNYKRYLTLLKGIDGVDTNYKIKKVEDLYIKCDLLLEDMKRRDLL